jgi:gamma-glutamyltranspeptidase/glutathione hydrolase
MGTRIAIAVLAAIVAGSAGDAGAEAPPPAKASNGMVVTAQRLASEVGADVLRSGGNAVDAAVAVGYALAVVHPCCGNIGGGGFATIRLADGTGTFLNFRETAPAAATPDMFLDRAGEPVPGLSTVGYKAVAVPGTVLGLEAMREAYGTMSRETLMAPAIRLARDGFPLGEADAAMLAGVAEDLAGQPNVTAIFFRDGAPLKAGDRLVQKDLARTLQAISDGGAGAFYEGGIAADVVAASEANGGILTLRDFAGYTVRETEPLRCGYRDVAIISAPPPSSGGTTICEILNIVEGWPIGEMGYGSAQSVHLLAEAMRHAFVDRNFLLGDPDFVDNPVERLVSDEYAAAIRASIDPGCRRHVRDGAARNAAARGHRDHALFDRRRRRERRCSDLHDQRVLRRQGHRRRYRLLPQQRDGRLHDPARGSQHVRSRAGREERDCAGQASAVVDEPDDRHP